MTVQPFKKDELTIETMEIGDVWHLNWLGKSEARDPATFLTPYLLGVSRQVAGKQLVVDFRHLQRMNSSTVMPIVHFIKELDAQKVTSTLIFNSDSHWQRMSFQALQTVCELLTYVKIQGKPLS